MAVEDIHDSRQQDDLAQIDRAHIWHPYSSMINRPPMLAVESATGVRLKLTSGGELIDAMSSWWCAIHGYNHPHLNLAARDQLDSMSHVMFGGLTHQPAIKLTQQLLQVTPASLETVFFADSGSVSVEVAIKMALQYWHAVGVPEKKRLLTVRNGYHGDTTGAMSVCDPINGMHHIFANLLPQHLFAEAPSCRFGQPCDGSQIQQLDELLTTHRDEIAAVILEPIVQGAGGMRIYSAEYLTKVRELCDQHQVLLILDEIATGFGRTGRYFACEHAQIEPDIMCVGKALSGGYLTLAATLSTRAIADQISDKGQGVFMHGPTFMANPLACAIASASLEILAEGHWQQQTNAIEQILREELSPIGGEPAVADVRILGAIGVLEFNQPIDVALAQRIAVEQGVWLRPFGRLLYTMPPYVIEEPDLRKVTQVMSEIAKQHAPFAPNSR